MQREAKRRVQIEVESPGLDPFQGIAGQAKRIVCDDDQRQALDRLLKSWLQPGSTVCALEESCILFFHVQLDACAQQIRSTVDALGQVGQALEKPAVGLGSRPDASHDEAAQAENVLDLVLAQLRKTTLQKGKVSGGSCETIRYARTEMLDCSGECEKRVQNGPFLLKRVGASQRIHL